MSKMVSIRISDKLEEKISEQADKRPDLVSFSAVIRWLIYEGIKKQS